MDNQQVTRSNGRHRSLRPARRLSLRRSTPAEADAPARISPRTARRRRGIAPRAAQAEPRRSAALDPWLRAQAINVSRHAEALRSFQRDEFGVDAAAPTEAHVQAANALIESLRKRLLRLSERVVQAAEEARLEPTTAALQRTLVAKERAHDWVRAVERVWDFYFELFGQRQSRYADWLLSCDRIAQDCYQVAYRGIATNRSIPTPPPFSYMRTGFSPATFRRFIPLRRLGRQLNPFPLIQLPYHRLVNPWTLGAVLHEVSHNLQNDLGLARTIPRSIARNLLEAGLPPSVAAVWTRWNREIYADLSGLLLGGPAIVASLMDVVGRAPDTTKTYMSTGPHPTPYLRVLISTECLSRMGHPENAREFRQAWMHCYPNPRAGSIPRVLLDTFPAACRIVVDTIAFRPYPELGNRSLAQVMNFEAKDEHMIEEAAQRLARGIDPGIIPERFLIGAARVALDHQLAPPKAITENFYKELARR
jgi:hypothetical protein